MLPVTNYRFRKSMGWEIKPSLLYQAYVWHSKRHQMNSKVIFEVPTVARDIIYGWARGLVGTFFQELFAPEIFTHKANSRLFCPECLRPWSLASPFGPPAASLRYQQNIT